MLLGTTILMLSSYVYRESFKTLLLARISHSPGHTPDFGEDQERKPGEGLQTG